MFSALSVTEITIIIQFFISKINVLNLDGSKILLFGKGVKLLIQYNLYSETTQGSNESGLLQQVVFKYWFYQVHLRQVVVSEQWSLKAGGLLIQVVSNTGLTVL